ncbi:MAG: tetratricopeptide repeat protein [Pseudomonadota bacterium]
MRFLITLLLTATLASPAFSAAGDSDNSYSNDDRRISRAGKLIEKERYPKAIKELRKALRKDDQNADAWNLLGFASRKMGELDTSADAYSKALALDPDHKGALEYQGELFITLGNIDKAKANLLKLQALCPSGCEELSDLEEVLAAIN